MTETETIHRVSRRGTFEYYRETVCPECERRIFIPEGEADVRRFDDLEIFNGHVCRPLFPVDLGTLSPGAAASFRTMVEAAFGKPLRRFTGALKGKGLPLHFTQEWKPELGHVPAFSKSDVHRPLDPEDGILKIAIPVIHKHFSRDAKTSIRKYFLSSSGVVKRERIGSKDVVRPVIRWKWPLRKAGGGTAG